MKEWKKVKLGELITIKNGKDHKSLKDGKYPVYGSGGIMRYVDKYLYDKIAFDSPLEKYNFLKTANPPKTAIKIIEAKIINKDTLETIF